MVKGSPRHGTRRPCTLTAVELVVGILVIAGIILFIFTAAAVKRDAGNEAEPRA